MKQLQHKIGDGQKERRWCFSDRAVLEQLKSESLKVKVRRKTKARLLIASKRRTAVAVAKYKSPTDLIKK